MSNLSREFVASGLPAGADERTVLAAAVPTSRADAKTMRAAPCFMLALAVLGMAVATYDSYALYTSQPLWCPPPIDGCNEVADSPYARIFDLPVGYYGAVYYLYMFALAALMAFDPLSRGLRAGAVLYATLGVLFSLYFMVLQVGFIHAFCIYCLVSAVTTVLLTITAARHWQATRLRTNRH